MSKLPIIKVYDVDYSFIIKNYLNPEMWTKKWTLFYYKIFVVDLIISSIYCYDDRVDFKVTITDKEDYKYKGEGIFFSNTTSTWVSYKLSIDNIDILKAKIATAIETLIEDLERKLIKLSTTYKEMESMERREEERLTAIAKNFLDDENVTNSDIREAYIEWFVDNSKSEVDFKQKYIESQKYLCLTDLFLIWAKTIDKKSLENDIIDKVGNNEITDKILEEYNEYKEYMDSEEYEEDKKEGLEDI